MCLSTNAFVDQMFPASSLMQLAADSDAMQRVESVPAYSDYRHNVVYLGQYKHTKHRLLEVREKPVEK